MRALTGLCSLGRGQVNASTLLSTSQTRTTSQTTTSFDSTSCSQQFSEYCLGLRWTRVWSAMVIQGALLGCSRSDTHSSTHTHTHTPPRSSQLGEQGCLRVNMHSRRTPTITLQPAHLSLSGPDLAREQFAVWLDSATRVTADTWQGRGGGASGSGMRIFSSIHALNLHPPSLTTPSHQPSSTASMAAHLPPSQRRARHAAEP